jgi:uncharacterized membrane protein
VTPLADETLLLFAGGLAVFAFVTVWPLRWLRTAGAAAAWALGVLVVYAFGRQGTSAAWAGFAALFAPFVVATLLGKLPGAARDRGRTAKQVLSNGLPAAIGAVLMLVPGWEPFGFHFVLGSLACLGADTCATEIGVRYGGVPRSVLSGRPLPAGESGGITSAGLVASLLGSLLAPGACFLVDRPPDVPGKILAALVGLYACAGFGAAILDSVLGATVQYRGRDPGGRVVEARRVGGQATEHVSGWWWLDNDAVNLLAGLAGGLLAVALISLWF